MNTIRRIIGFPVILIGAVFFQLGFMILDNEMQERFAERFMAHLLKAIGE